MMWWPRIEKKQTQTAITQSKLEMQPTNAKNTKRKKENIQRENLKQKD